MFIRQSVYNSELLFTLAHGENYISSIHCVNIFKWCHRERRGPVAGHLAIHVATSALEREASSKNMICRGSGACCSQCFWQFPNGTAL